MKKVDRLLRLLPQKSRSILNSYTKSNSSNPNKALSLFKRLRQEESSSSIDSFILLFALKACNKLSSPVNGKQIHAVTIIFGFESIIFLQTALLKFYSTIGDLRCAHQLFDEMPHRNVVCWTALVSAYVDNRKPSTALELFRQMQKENVEPDRVTITTSLAACADLGALDMGEWIHAYIYRKRGFEVDLCLKNALVNMYAKCGDVGMARRVFDGTKQRDLTTWTSMIVGHAVHGQAEEALKLFTDMKNSRKNNNGDAVIPNEVTFIGVLMACSHAGWVEKGLKYLDSMTKDFHLKPQMSHYGCMVDLFCRAGLLEEAYTFVKNMPIKPNAVVWRTLLGACSLHGNVELGANIRCELLKLEPNYVGDDVTIANLYAAAGLWDEKTLVREQIKQRRAPGCSSIKVERSVHEFVASDRKHPQLSEIYGILEGLTDNLRTSTYVPDTFESG